MPKLPIISGKKLLSTLVKNGFVEVRRKGSHAFVKNLTGIRTTIIPIHSNEDLGKGILKSILNDLEISVEDLIAMI